MLKARDIMTRDVQSVHVDTGVEEVARIFMDKRFNSLPVLDDRGGLVGIVTETDLVAQDRPLHIPTVINIFDWFFYLESEKSFEEEVRKITAGKVGDICTREVLTCTPETPVTELASMMVDKGMHLIPVIEDETLVGVVARLDIIRAMVG